ncbi:MAG: hypothetical protein NUV47_02310 [Patescibacteria group bacterium]|nr:hypothetical protein [Patescibacteria group bacterium]
MINIALALSTIIVFVSPPQTLQRNVVSQPLTVQVQEEGTGLKIKAGETIDLTVTSSSKTGEFSSNSTSWKKDNTFVINRTFSNRNFYYKDSTSGEYIITAIMKGRESGKVWITTEPITIQDKIVQSPSVIPIISTYHLATSTPESQVISIEKEPSNQSFLSKVWSFIKRLFF